MQRGIFLTTFWVFGIIALFTININAQSTINPYSTAFSMQLGRSVPIGNFASMSGERAGYAKVGLCADINSATLLIPHLNWSNSINVSTNAFNQTAYSVDDPYVTISTGRHFTCWILSGLAVDISASDKFIAYVSGQIGLLISGFPDIIFKQHYEDSGFILDHKFEQTAKSATSIAYGLSAGIKVKLIHLAIRYNYAVPRYHVTAKSWSASYLTETTRSSMEVPTGMLQFLAGINF